MSRARHGVEWPAVPRGSKLGEEEEGDEAYWTHQGPEKETPGRTLAVRPPRRAPSLAGCSRLPAAISGLKRTCGALCEVMWLHILHMNLPYRSPNVSFKF